MKNRVVKDKDAIVIVAEVSKKWKAAIKIAEEQCSSTAFL